MCAWARQVLLFVDCLTHGAARRSNPGVRRTIWHRSDSDPHPLLCLVTSWPEPLLTLRCRSYTMAWSRLRWGYTPSTELCERLAAGTPPLPHQQPAPEFCPAFLVSASIVCKTGPSPRRASIVDPHFGRMLPIGPHADQAAEFEEGDP